VTAATLTSRQRAELDPPGAPPRDEGGAPRPLTPVGTRVIWRGGRYPVFGAVARHSSHSSLHWIYIEWAHGGEGRFFDNAWPWELRRDEGQPASVCPTCGRARATA
jgi:hypothetical protein